MVIGHKRHGKDTVSEILRDQYGLPFRSSSEAANDIVVFPALSKRYGYKNPEECFNDRGAHREEWFQLISAYNTPNKTRLGRKIYETSRIYCGIRCGEELAALQNAGVVGFTIWVDGSRRLPPEDTSSCTISPAQADYILDNNSAEEDLELKVHHMMFTLERWAHERRHTPAGCIPHFFSHFAPPGHAAVDAASARSDAVDPGRVSYWF